ncbi:MFS transporter [Aurantiacibacter poecillastricola]|uniref:MFS transporter n=1 Tax=Aurantiacibacter poecillastricola TaxID=3064385 RepID=UPI00273FC658|nr:MFS transporter [Aurantiacibacter sp. 219JJ12-13]MDP5262934.1 MFS transporter [Aurantiacibacter sp. 219JJ12-13]
MRSTGWKVVAILAATQTLAFFHRSLATLLAEPIRLEYGVSDTMIGVLIGAAFSISFVIAAFPLGHLSDHRHRFRLLGIYVTIWSILTSLAAAASSFALLLLLRAGSASAMSGVTPAAGSLLADRYSGARLAKPMGIYSSGIYFGVGFSLLVGGGLAAWFDPFALVHTGILPPLAGWKVIYLLSGLPGLLLAAILVTRPDPQRSAAPASPAERSGPILAFLTERPRNYLRVLLALTMLVLVATAVGAWLPSLFVGKHGWAIEDIGLWSGAIVISAGLLGTLGSGFLVQAAQRITGMPRPQAPVLILAATISAPLAVALPLVSSPYACLALFFCRSFLGGIIIALGYSILLSLAPSEQRGRLTAITGISLNLIGGALAPIAVAVITDLIFADPQDLPLSLAIVNAFGSIAAAIILLTGARTLLSCADTESDAAPRT